MTWVCILLHPFSCVLSFKIKRLCGRSDDVPCILYEKWVISMREEKKEIHICISQYCVCMLASKNVRKKKKNANWYIARGVYALKKKTINVAWINSIEYYLMYVSFYFKDSIVSTAGLSHLTTFPSTCKVIRVISDRKFFKFKLYRLFQLCFELYYCQVSRFYKKLWELSFNQMSKFGRFVKANELIRVEVCVTKPIRFA